VPIEATQAVGVEDSGAEDESCALSSTALVKLKNTIKFSGGCSMNTPTWCASCQCFTTTPTEGYPRGGEFVDRVSLRLGTRRYKEHKVYIGSDHRECNTLRLVWFLLS
jgi:hypothetical protein